MTDHPPSLVRLLTIDDVAAVLHVSPRTVRRMIAAGQIHVIRLGRMVRVHPSVVSELMDNSGQE